ncbi:hypothetical protein ACFVXG_45530 [Kitasatospora sp. NPDC058162]|uniref:hypothetical protein n=1 Tax=Kitasatospora sp. NPDC058162 TaxID=3346362 RepID=UPI0036DC7988
MFRAGEEVLIVACEDDPKAVGKVGRILDDLDPGEFPSHLTGGRWTVTLGWWEGSKLCHTHELQKVA